MEEIAYPGKLIGTTEDYISGEGTYIRKDKIYASLKGPI